MSATSKVVFLPVLPVDGSEGFAVGQAEARSVVEAHLKVTMKYDLENIRKSSAKGIQPYQAALAMALKDMGFDDLLSEEARSLTRDDVERLEQKFPFLICFTDSDLHENKDDF